MGKKKSVTKSQLRLVGQQYLDAVLDGTTEDRDCTVHAMAAAFNIPYWQAHRFLAKHGRKIRAGGNIWNTIGEGSRTLFGCRVGKRIVRPGKTVGTFVKKHQTGTFMMVAARHAFVVKDGKTIGLSEKNYGQRIRYYWRVTKIERDQVNPMVYALAAKLNQKPG